MNPHYVEIEIGFHSVDGSPEAFDDFLDCVLEEFDKIGREVDVTASLARYRARFLSEVSDEEETGLIEFLGDIRTALHAVACATPGWPTHEILMAQPVRDRRDLASR